jgi:Protein of unknown function (DUF2769)
VAKVEDTQENIEICVKYCGVCPSKPQVFGEVLYCSRGKSVKEVVEKGCNCPGCGVYAKYGLAGSYFCKNGAAE